MPFGYDKSANESTTTQLFTGWMSFLLPNQQCQSTEGTIALHTYQFNGPFSRTTRVSRYQKGKTNLDFTEARDSEWLWHQLGRMQVCTSLQTDNQASTPPLSFLQAGCPSCRPTNSVKAMKAFKAMKATIALTVRKYSRAIHSPVLRSKG